MVSQVGAKLVALCTNSDDALQAHILTNDTLVASGTCAVRSTNHMQQHIGLTWFDTTALVPVDVVGPCVPMTVASQLSCALSSTAVLGMVQVGQGNCFTVWL